MPSLTIPLPAATSYHPSFHTDYVSPLEQSGTLFETFHGFVNTAEDCRILVQQCIHGRLPLLTNESCQSSSLRIRSGTVLVFESGTLKAFREGGKFSYSRARGPFLLYREVEHITQRNHSRSHRHKGYPESPMFHTTAVRPNTRVVVNGLVKRTAAVVGSNGVSYRVVSYFYPKDVDALNPSAYLKTPSQIPQFHLQLPTPFITRSPTPEFVVKSHMSPSPRLEHALSPSPESRASPVLHYRARLPEPSLPCISGQLRSLKLESNWMNQPVLLHPLLS
ncbi:hypothetical protein HDU98_000567 [Podochytrium sp. JEL0797]|nr:hypothetical protein HDU98_000567 [Podochytrium sp. JEL0797]